MKLTRFSDITLIVFGVAVLGCASAAYGNTGSAVIMISAVHLALANIAFGIIEWLIVRRFSTRPFYSLPTLIAGNYVSAWVGYPVLFVCEWAAILVFGPAQLHNGLTIAISAIIAAMVLGLVIEWPFFYRALGPVRSRRRTAVIVTLIGNAMTYPLVVLGYWTIASTTLYTDLEHTTPERVLAGSAFEGEATLYFIGSDNQSVWQMRLDGSARYKLVDRPLGDDAFLIGVAREEGKFAVMLGSWEGEYSSQALDDLNTLELIASDEGIAAIDPSADRMNGESLQSLVGTSQYKANRLPPGSSGWGVRLYRNAVLITVEQPIESRGVETRYAFDLPVRTTGLLAAGRGTILPGDVLVFSLGVMYQHRNWPTNEICIVDLRNRRIASLGNGNSPTVILKSGSPTEPRPESGR